MDFLLCGKSRTICQVECLFKQVNKWCCSDLVNALLHLPLFREVEKWRQRIMGLDRATMIKSWINIYEMRHKVTAKASMWIGCQGCLLLWHAAASWGLVKQHSNTPGIIRSILHTWSYKLPPGCCALGSCLLACHVCLPG